MTNQFPYNFSRIGRPNLSEIVFTDVRHRVWLRLEDQLMPPDDSPVKVPYGFFAPIWELAVKEISR